MHWVAQSTGLPMKAEYQSEADTSLISAETVSKMLILCLKKKAIGAWG